MVKYGILVSISVLLITQTWDGFCNGAELKIPILSGSISGYVILEENELGVVIKPKLDTNVEDLKLVIYSGPTFAENYDNCGQISDQRMLSNISDIIESILMPNKTMEDLLGHTLRIFSKDLSVCSTIFPVIPKKGSENQWFQIRYRGPKLYGSLYVLQTKHRLKIFSQLNLVQGQVEERLAWSLTSLWQETSTNQTASISEPTNQIVSNPTLMECRRQLKNLHPQSSESSSFLIGEQQTVDLYLGEAVASLNSSIFVTFGPEKTDRTELYQTSREIWGCSPLQLISTQTADVYYSDHNNTVITFKQANPFTPVVITNKAHGDWFIYPQPISSCDGLKTELLKKMRFGMQLGPSAFLLPDITLFGNQTTILQSIMWKLDDVTDPMCAPLLSSIPSKIVEARFYYPFTGSVSFQHNGIDPETTIITSQLRHMFDTNTTFSNWALYKGGIKATLDQLSCSGVTLQDFTIQAFQLEECDFPLCWIGNMSKFLNVQLPVWPYNIPNDVPLTRVVSSHHPLDGPQGLIGNTLLVDIGWNQGCSNLRFQSESLTAPLVRYGPTRRPQVGEMTVADRLGFRTDVKYQFEEKEIDDAASFNASMHSLPIDLTASGSHPCSQGSFGPKIDNWNILNTKNKPVKLKGLSSKTIYQNYTDLSHIHGTSIGFSNSRQLICGTLDYNCDQYKMAAAYFDDTNINGFVFFTQPKMEQNSVAGSSTLIKISLQKQIGIEMGLDWALYPKVEEFIVEESEKCDISIKDSIYNPFFLSEKHSAYPSTCGRDKALCVLGDLTGKFGPLNIYQREIYSDKLLPLDGPYSIIGSRLKLSNNIASSCAVVELLHAISFDLIASDKTRPGIQEKMSKLLVLHKNFIGISYNHTEYSPTCSKYSIKIHVFTATLKFVEQKIPEVMEKMATKDCLALSKLKNLQRPSHTSSGTRSRYSKESFLFILALVVKLFCEYIKTLMCN